MLNTPGSKHSKLYYPQARAPLWERWLTVPSTQRPTTREDVAEWVTERERLFSPTMRGLIARLAALNALRSGHAITTEGREHIPKTGPVIFGINHPTKTSPMYIGSVALEERKDLIAVGKKELEEGVELGKPTSWLQQKFMSNIALPIIRPEPGVRLLDPATQNALQELVSRSRAIMMAPEGGTDRYTQSWGKLEDGLRIVAARSKSSEGELVRVVPTNIDPHNHITFYPPILGTEFRIGYPSIFIDQVFPVSQYPRFDSLSWRILQNIQTKLNMRPMTLLEGRKFTNLIDRLSLIGDQSSVDRTAQIGVLSKLSGEDPEVLQGFWKILDESRK